MPFSQIVLPIDGGIGAERCRPEVMADHDHRRRARQIVLRADRAAQASVARRACARYPPLTKTSARRLLIASRCRHRAEPNASARAMLRRAASVDASLDVQKRRITPDRPRRDAARRSSSPPSRDRPCRTAAASTASTMVKTDVTTADGDGESDESDAGRTSDACERAAAQTEDPAHRAVDGCTSSIRRRPSRRSPDAECRNRRDAAHSARSRATP